MIIPSDFLIIRELLVVDGCSEGRELLEEKVCRNVTGLSLESVYSGANQREAGITGNDDVEIRRKKEINKGMTRN